METSYKQRQRSEQVNDLMESRDIMVGENNAKKIIEFIMELDIEIVVDIPGS